MFFLSPAFFAAPAPHTLDKPRMTEGGLPLIAANPSRAPHETEQMLSLLSRLDTRCQARDVLDHAEEICRLLSLYSFRAPQRADRLCAELSSRYRKDALALYGSAFLLRRQSDSAYLRLEQLLPVLIRVAALRLVRAGILSLSLTQLTLSDGMLLRLLEKEAKQKAGG